MKMKFPKSRIWSNKEEAVNNNRILLLSWFMSPQKLNSYKKPTYVEIQLQVGDVRSGPLPRGIYEHSGGNERQDPPGA